MNAWLRDGRIERAEVDVFNAERCERRGDFAQARGLYRAAADAYASVAVGVHADHPNTRSDLAIAAIVCFARAGDLDQEIGFAERMLAESDALTEHGRSELRRLGADYTVSLRALRDQPTRAPENRGRFVRDEVRNAFKWAEAA